MNRTTRAVRNRSLPLALAMTLVLASAIAGAARAAFEDIEVSPRVRGLGGSWVALESDPYAALHNPASLAWADRGAAMSYVRPFGYDFASQSVASATAALPRKIGGVGIALRHFGVTYDGVSLAGETTVSLAHGFRLFADRQSELALGWSLGIHSLEFGPSITGLDPGSATSTTLNLGAQAVVRDRTRVGFYSLNVTNATIGELDQESLRRGVWAGLSYEPYPGVVSMIDLSNELGENIQYRGGAEFAVTDNVQMRAGVRTEPSVFTAGLGFRLARMQLDYGFSTGGGVLGETHQFGLAIARPGPR